MANNHISMKQSDKSNGLWLLFIAIGSVLAMLLMTGFSNELFLYDDNRNQWMPIMDKAYDQFFSTGIMPNYDFYQSKGLEIGDEGYYCLQNPLTMIAYILYRFVFFKSWGSTLSFYTLMMVTLGNITAFMLCRTLGADKIRSLIVVLIYATSSAFYMFSYWYYIFNNYWIIPLLLYVTVKFSDWKISYIACGIILAFDLLMGNVQYTVYHYCIYCMIMLGMGIFGKKNHLLKMLTNCITGILLTIPQLLLLMQSSTRSYTYNNTGEITKILGNMISWEGILYGIFLPGALFSDEQRASLYGIFYNHLIDRDEIWILYAGGFGLCLYGLAGYGIYCAVKKISALRKQSNSEQLQSIRRIFRQNDTRAFYIGVILAILFTISLFTAGTAAKIMIKLPVVKNFRFVFKAYFVFLPLCIVPSALFLKKVNHRIAQKILYGICAVLIAIGGVNSFFLEQQNQQLFCEKITDRYPNEITVLEHQLHEKHIDRDNYRVLSVADGEGDVWSYFDIINKIQRNIGTTVNVFTMGGYDFTECDKALEQSFYLMSDKAALYGNSAMFYSFDDSDPEIVERAVFIENELQYNSVKYIIVDNKQHIIDMVTHYINDYMENIRVIQTFPFMENCCMLVLDGVSPLCADMRNNPVTLHSQMDKLSFDIDGNNTLYRLAFTYKDSLRADYRSADGTVSRQIPTSEDENGYLLVDTAALANGTVTVTYTNGLLVTANITAMIISLLFAGICLLAVRAKKWEAFFK